MLTSPLRQRRLDRKRQANPFSARPRLRIVPARIGAPEKRLLKEQARCTTNEQGCWLYPAIRDEAYPYVTFAGDDGQIEQWSARRFVWALKHGEIPERGIILGFCPFTACVNPDHQALWVPPVQLDWVATP